MSYLLNIFKYWKFIGVGILLVIIGIEYYMLNNRNITINELNNNINYLNNVIQTNNTTIKSYEQKAIDDSAKIVAVNEQLTHCTTRLNIQVKELLSIEDIMNQTDESIDEPASVPEPVTINKPIQEVKPNATQTISNTTQTKGIDFINSQFDSIK